jgi:Arc/MetJ-type ribon-helix-helix transcriptional regulator
MKTSLDVLQRHPHLRDWRKWLVDPIVPKGEEGDTRPLSIAFPREMLTRIDRIKKATNNSRSAVIKYLLRWALDAYDKLREDEKNGVHDEKAHDDAA